MLIETSKLKKNAHNSSLFYNLRDDDYNSLKKDIAANGIKTELHVNSSYTVLCGHQRLKIAEELGIRQVPCKIVSPENEAEYAIKDNLLRRQLTTEQRYILIAELSKIYESGRGGDRRSEDFKRDRQSPMEDVNDKTSKALGVSRKTVQRARKYNDIVSLSPELKTKTASCVLSGYDIKDNKTVKKNSSVKIDMDNLNSYDNNLFYLSERKDMTFDNDVICVDTSHNKTRIFKTHYPTVTTCSTFVDKNGKEFSLRKYAEVQDFPPDFKFVGNKGNIRDQIGEAVSPKMAEYVIKKHIHGKTYIELCCGAGGLTLGAERCGKVGKWAIDFNKFACYAHKLNFKDIPIICDDLKSVDEKKILEEIGQVDFIMGGIPCQGFSRAGLKLSFKEDSRNQLYLEFLRFVKCFRPRQFLIENVPEILKHKDEIIKDFNDIGYNVKTEPVKGKDIGMRQHRDRAFFIGEIRPKL